MKKLLIALLLGIGFLSHAQIGSPPNIVQIVPMEYTTGFLGSDQNMYMIPNAGNGDGTYVGSIPLPNGELVSKVAGAFNHFLVVSTVGHLWLNGYYNQAAGTWVQIATDSAGNSLNNVTNVWASEDTYVIEINNGTSYEYGGNDGLGLFYPSDAGGVNMRAMPLSVNGRHFKKFGMNFYSMAAIGTHSDTAYCWLAYNARSLSPTYLVAPNTLLDIAVWGANAYNNAVMTIVAQTSGDTTVGNLYAYGQGWGQWAGNAGYNSLTSIESFWTAGPWKSIQMSDNSTHALNYRGRIYGAGMQVQGEVGNGVEFVNRYTYAGYPGSIGWDFQGGENLATTPQPIDTSHGFAGIYKGTFFNFYTYGLDSSGKTYVWGRNKSLVQGDGQWTGYTNNDANPNILDHSSPRLVNVWDSATTTLDVTMPTRGASVNNSTITTTSATLSNTGTALYIVKHTGGQFICCSYSGFTWTQEYGPNTATITSPTGSTTTVTGLINGNYRFRVNTFDSNNGQDTAGVSFTVSLSGAPPTVNAGADQTLLLPTSSTSVNGTATGNGGATITSTIWSCTSHPGSSPVIVSPTTLTTSITGLTTTGSYIFQLSATDNNGNTSIDTMTVEVNQAPTVNAGSNQTITLPVSSASLSGTVTYYGGATGSTAVYTCTGFPSGASSPSITSGGSVTAPTASVSGMTTAGVYTFKLTAIDSNGNSANATMTVTINAVQCNCGYITSPIKIIINP